MATRDEFAKAVVTSGLLSVEDLQTFWKQLPAEQRPKDGETFGAVLVQKSRLTEYQKAEVLAGRGKGLVLGNYVILDKLGQGGMGMVLKAEHKRMKRLVALKVLSPTVTKSPESMRRFQREVEAAAKLEHPNIVTAYDADEANGTHFFVMQFVEGRDLAAHVKDRGAFSLDEAVRCVVQAAKGLEFAHQRGVVHRDIKPHNLLLDREGTVKILDMGLARLESAGAEQDQLTGTGQIMGTVDYMAPEQAMDTKHADARADIYSLGVTLWYLLTAKPLYEGDTVVKKLMGHQTQPIPSLTATRGDISPALDGVFRRMVAKRVEERFQSMTQVIAALEAFRTDGGLRGDVAPTATFSPSDSATLQRAMREASSRSVVAVSTPAAGVSPLSLERADASPRPLTDVGLEQTVSLPAPTTDTDSRASVAEVVRLQPSISRESGSPAPAAFPVDTTPRPRSSPRKPSGPAWWRDRRVQIGAGVGGFVLLLLLGIVVIVRDKDGKEVGRVQVPDGGTVTVAPDDKPPTPASGPQPPLAKAPFDAKQARAHQEAWAKHLGIKVETSNSVGAKLILIPPGEFLMGSSDEQIEAATRMAAEMKVTDVDRDNALSLERTQHRVTITKPWLCGATEITVEQFRRFVESTKYVTEVERNVAPDREFRDKKLSWRDPEFSVGDDCAVRLVTWNDAVMFCNWLSEQEQLPPSYRQDGSNWQLLPSPGYRLPTDAEWEFACRAGTTTLFYFGDDANKLGDYAWFNLNNGYQKAHPVGQKRPNPFGLFDLLGGVEEWCNDGFDHRRSMPYGKSAATDPVSSQSSVVRVVRGGSWMSPGFSCRSASRFGRSFDLTSRYAPRTHGFRVVRVLDLPAASPSGTADSDRRLAEHVLNAAANRQVTVMIPGKPGQVSVAKVADLPKEPFHVTTVTTNDYDAELIERILPLERLQEINISPAVRTDLNDSAIQRLLTARSAKNWTRLGLASDTITDAGLLAISQTCASLNYLYLQRCHLVTDIGFSHLRQLPQVSNSRFVDSLITDTALESLRQNNLTALELRNCQRVTDNGLKLVAAFPKLTSLTLESATITDRGIEQLQPPAKLLVLQLRTPACTDRCLDTVANMNSLNHFSVTGVPITDTGLAKLHGLTSLTALSLVKTQVTPAGVAKFKAALPKCVVASDVASGSAGKLTKLDEPAFQQWLQQTAALPDVSQQTAAVAKKLQELNPQFDGKFVKVGRAVIGRTTVAVTEVRIESPHVFDLSPLLAWPELKFVACTGIGGGGDSNKLSDLSALTGLKLTSLLCYRSQVSDLTPLAGMPLTRLWISETKVSTLSPLAKLPLTDVDCSSTLVRDLTPLRGMRLTILSCHSTAVSDLTPLRGMPLVTLDCLNTQVADLTPLHDCQQLTSLRVKNTKVTAAGVAALQQALPNCKIEWDKP